MGIIGAITGAWTQVMTWLTTSMASVQTVFYADNSLTFLGTLCVISVAIGVSLLIVNIIKSFLQLG